MKRLLCGIGVAFLLSGYACAEAAAPAAKPPATADREIPAGAKLVDEDKLPRCFVDKNKDNVCDKSVLAGGKCKANHVKRVPPAKAKETPEAEAAEEKPAPAPKTGKLGCVGCGRCLIGKSCLA